LSEDSVGVVRAETRWDPAHSIAGSRKRVAAVIQSGDARYAGGL